MRIVECEQLSVQWFEARRGLPTSSQFHRIITPAQAKYAAAADDYLNELVAEMFHDGPLCDLDKPMSQAMLHGVETEAEARSFYDMEYANGIEVKRVGLCLTDDGRFGSSPDALVGDDGVLELKAPTSKTQVSYLRQGVLPPEYKCQCHGHLLVTGRKFCDFFSYHQTLPKFLVRVTPDEFTEALRKALDVFHLRLLEALAKIRGM